LSATCGGANRHNRTLIAAAAPMNSSPTRTVRRGESFPARRPDAVAPIMTPRSAG
jgi:hypothetical protein